MIHDKRPRSDREELSGVHLWERPREENWSRCPLFRPPGPEVGRASFPAWRETRSGGDEEPVRPAERNAASTEIMNGRGFAGVRPVWKTVGGAGFAGDAKEWSVTTVRCLLIRRSISASSGRSSKPQKEIAVPEAPARPVRPIRWTYASGSFGRS